MSKLLKRAGVALGYLAVLIVVFILLSVIFSGGSHLYVKGYESMSLSRMCQLATAVKLYKEDHDGAMPAKLSELYPQYVPYVDAFLFQSPYTNSVRPTDSSLDPQKVIQIYSPYVLMPLEKGRYVIFERPDLWRSGKAKIGFVLSDMISSGFYNAQVVTPDQFQRLLSQGFPSLDGSGTKASGT